MPCDREARETGTFPAPADDDRVAPWQKEGACGGRQCPLRHLLPATRDHRPMTCPRLVPQSRARLVAHWLALSASR